MKKNLQIKNNSGIKGKLRFITYKAATKEILRKSDWIKNLVVSNTNHGLNLIAKALIGVETYGLEISQAKIGDNNTAATNEDVDLKNTIVDGILVATVEETTTSQITIEFFIADAELPEDTYEEFGIFVGEQLFARTVISPVYVKSIGEDTKIEYKIDLNNV